MNNFNPVVITLALIALIGGVVLGYFGSDIIEQWFGDPDGSLSLEDGKVSYPLPPSADTVVISRNTDIQWNLNDVITLVVPPGNGTLKLMSTDGYWFVDAQPSNVPAGSGSPTSTPVQMCMIPKDQTYKLIYKGANQWEINLAS